MSYVYYRTMDEIRRAASESDGSRLWFSRDTMDAWESRVESDVIGGHWFVTSEAATYGRNEEPCRVYSVRFCDNEGEVGTAPGTTVGEYADLGDAMAAAEFIASIVKAYANENVTVH